METIHEYETWTHNLKILKRPLWDDKASLFCKICGKEFSFFRRQHHCRNCGIVVCKLDANKKIKMHELGYTEKQRICTTCFNNKILL